MGNCPKMRCARVVAREANGPLAIDFARARWRTTLSTLPVNRVAASKISGRDCSLNPLQRRWEIRSIRYRIDRAVVAKRQSILRTARRG